MNMRFLLSLLLFCFAAGALSAQGSAADLKKRARDFLSQGKYTEAKAVISSSRELTRDDKEGRFLLAVTNYHLHLLDESLAQLQELGEQDRYPFPECRLYLGKIYHARHEFAEAGRQYKKYLKTLPASSQLRRAVWNEIKRCNNGLELQFKTSPVFVENLGPEINSSDDEFAPVPSPTYMDRIYFSSIRKGNAGGMRDERGNPDDVNGRYSSDMFSARLSGGKWGQAQPLPYHLNSPRHEVLADVNTLGNAMFYFKGLSLQKGEILIDTFRQGTAPALTSDPFIGPLNPLEGEVSFHLFNDTLLIFSSARAGGFGGFDLYRSSKVNGRWSAPENLGSEVNSAFDETTPYLLRDGRSLFFSSNNSAGSIGGMDIFKSVWNPRSKRWSAPENPGIPVNSAADDTHFRLSRDGFTAFFASSRKDGFGQRDLYVAYFSDFLELEPMTTYVLPQPTQVATPTATQRIAVSEPVSVTVVPARTTVIQEEQPRTVSTWPLLRAAESFKTDGNAHAVAMKSAADYLKAHPEVRLSLMAFVKNQEAPGTALFAGIGYAEAAASRIVRMGVAPDRVFVRAALAQWDAPSAGACVLMMRWMPESGQSAPEYAPLQQQLPKATYNAALEAPLLYKVQVTSLKGAYTGDLLTKFPDGMVEKSHGVDFYRYTLGAFTKFAEAETFKKQLAARGQSSAFITAYVHGFRIERSAAHSYVRDFPDLRSFLGN